jgi:hypothetical protein
MQRGEGWHGALVQDIEYNKDFSVAVSCQGKVLERGR